LTKAKLETDSAFEAFKRKVITEIPVQQQPKIGNNIISLSSVASIGASNPA
jgi:hypothetical protein